jgi:hypothetical protein
MKPVCTTLMNNIKKEAPGFPVLLFKMIGWLTDSFSSQPESPFDSALMPLSGTVRACLTKALSD